MISIEETIRPPGVMKMCTACSVAGIGLLGINKCNGCSERKFTIYTCPKCGGTAHYVGLVSKSRCSMCETKLPLIENLKVLRSSRKRIYFGV
jgi:hypothetical protein